MFEQVDDKVCLHLRVGDIKTVVLSGAALIVPFGSELVEGFLFVGGGILRIAVTAVLVSPDVIFV